MWSREPCAGVPTPILNSRPKSPRWKKSGSALRDKQRRQPD